MPLRSPAAWLTLLILVLSAGVLITGPSRAASFVDAAERYVILPDRVGRVVTANPPADVLVFALAPDKLVGWSVAPSRGQRAYLPAKFARLPNIGRLNRPNPAETVQVVARMHPDLIVESGPVSAEAATRADWVQQQTGIPYIVLDNSIQSIPGTLRTLGGILGVGPRGEGLAYYADTAIDALRGRLLIADPTERPLVYYGRGPDGLESGLAGAQAMAAIDQAGVINVVARLGHGELTRVTRDQIIAWNPAIIIAEERSFYNALLRNAEWRGLKAVSDKHVYLAPADPFGWIDDPPGLNRIIGLYWLTALFYPDQYQEDLRTNARTFYDQFYGVKLTDRQLEALVRGAEASAGETRRQIDVPLLGAEPVPLPNAAPNAPAPGGRPPGRGGPGAPGLTNPPIAPRTPQ
jgi:iron complex transport system substrate-binding protein